MDSEEESESDHDETDIRWKKPKEWDQKVLNDPLLQLGDMVWTVPAHRDSVVSEDTGMHVESDKV